MRFKVDIDTSNAAFEPEAGSELARILRRLAHHLDGQTDPMEPQAWPLRDGNGNVVGHAGWEE